MVEDEERVRSLVRRVLGGQGYRVLEATDGAEALAQAREAGGKIDLLLTDVVMPGMSGQELAARLRQLGWDFKALFMSGYAAGVIEQRGELAEAEVIAKPFGARELLARIRRALDQP